VREKLKYLDAAVDLRDLMIPLSNQLEALKGERKGQYSIRVNQQWVPVLPTEGQGRV
jgi:toxin HigB-1